jgi:NhaP-type Na+/H+ or K+/H+ antiporter
MGYDTIAYAAETLVFIFLGLGLFAFRHPFAKTGFGLFSLSILVILFSRFLNVFLVSLCVNRARKKNKLSCKY